MVCVWLALFLAIPSALVISAESSDSRNPAPIVSHIPRQPVQSSAIAKIGYSKRRHILEIEFVNGAIYRYLDVPSAVYRDLISAESKARFYDSNIKGHYRSVRVRSQEKEQVPAK